MILDEQGEEGEEGSRRRAGRGDKYKREVEREVERIKVKVRFCCHLHGAVIWIQS